MGGRAASMKSIRWDSTLTLPPFVVATFYESFLPILATPLTPHRGQRRYSSVSSGGENNSTAGGPGRFNLAERGLAAIQSPRKPNGLSHCIFECLIVEAFSQAQNHLSVLADRYTKRCRGVFDCTGDG